MDADDDCGGAKAYVDDEYEVKTTSKAPRARRQGTMMISKPTLLLRTAASCASCERSTRTGRVQREVH